MIICLLSYIYIYTYCNVYLPHCVMNGAFGKWTMQGVRKARSWQKPSKAPTRPSSYLLYTPSMRIRKNRVWLYNSPVASMTLLFPFFIHILVRWSEMCKYSQYSWLINAQCERLIDQSSILGLFPSSFFAHNLSAVAADEVQEEEGLRFTVQSDPTASGWLDRWL